MWLNKSLNLNIYAEDFVINIIKDMIKLYNLDSKTNPVNINYITINDLDKKSQKIIIVNDYSIFAFRTTHGNEIAFGIKIINDLLDENIVFSSDAVADKKIEDIIDKKTKVLIQDCGAGLNNNNSHGGAIDLNKILLSTIKKVYLTHLNDFSIEYLEKMRGSIHCISSENIVIASDFSTLIFEDI
jgi:hypothetical protein